MGPSFADEKQLRSTLGNGPLQHTCSRILLGGLVALLLSTTAVSAQVEPDSLRAEKLRASIDEVLPGTPEVTWSALPLPDSVEAALQAQLNGQTTLPDTLFVGRAQTSDGLRFLIPDVAPSKSETFSFVLYLTSSGAVVDVDVLTYRESYGYEIDYPMFRRQFHGTTDPQSIRFRRSIQNISGATISARSLTHAVHDLLVLVNHLGTDALR